MAIMIELSDTLALIMIAFLSFAVAANIMEGRESTSEKESDNDD